MKLHGANVPEYKAFETSSYMLGYNMHPIVCYFLVPSDLNGLKCLRLHRSSLCYREH